MAFTSHERAATASGRNVLLAFLVAWAVYGCGGGSSGGKTPQTPRCVRASDCTGALACIQGFCVEACVESKDCPAGQRCIPAAASTAGNSCQPPEKASCTYTSDCTLPLVCGVDLQCRSQCKTNVDCPSKQVCTAVTKLCADPTIDLNYDPVTNEFKAMADGGIKSDASAVVAPDAGTAVDAPTTSVEAGLPGADAGLPDAPAIGDAPVTDSRSADTAAALPDVATVPDVSLTFDAPALVADGVVVTPSPSVRQGQLNVTVTITRAAGGLASAALFDFGDLTARAQTGSTDTSLVLKVSVPHGAPLGKRTLRVATGTGVITAVDAVDVTAITAGPTGLDTNAGSAASPFLTLKQAFLVADAGDTIRLMEGVYNSKGGETWGYVVPNNLTIVGDSTAGTVIDGVGATSSPNGFNASANLTLKTLTLQHFNYGIDVKVPASTITLQDVVVAGNSSYAIYVEGASTGSTISITGKASLIDQPGQSGIYVYNAPNTTVNITDATLQGGSNVVYFGYNCSGSKLNITGGTIKQLATYDAINIAPSSNTAGTTTVITKATIIGNIANSDAKGSMTITGSTITQKSGNGVDFSGAALSMVDTSVTMTAANTGIYFSSVQGTMSLKGVTVTGGGYGIQQLGTGSSAKVRGTTITGTTYNAYYLTAGDLDLGTATESGDNVIGAPTSTSYYCLYIYRPQGASAGNPVTCSGTTLNGLAPNPGTIDASAGTVTLQPQRYSVSTGNKLIFY